MNVCGECGVWLSVTCQHSRFKRRLHAQPVQIAPDPPWWPGGQASVLRVADLGSIPAVSMGSFTGCHTIDLNMSTPCWATGLIGSALGLVG